MSDSTVVLRWWRRSLIAISGTSAAVASFIFLRELALHAGWPQHLAILVPLAIDALAAAALTEYTVRHSRWAGFVAILVVAGSATGNAFSHLYSTGIQTPGWVAVTLVGSVPAITAGFVIHLFAPREKTAWNRDTSSTNGTSGTSSSAPSANTGTATGTAPAATAAVPKSNGTKPSSTRRTDTELVSMLRSNSWQNETADFLTSHLSVSKSRALRVREQARSNGNGTHP
jgi:hypothetical protein